MFFYVTDGQKYWHETDKFSSCFNEIYQFYYEKPPSNDIEMTAYALLTYTRRKAFISALPILKWLTSKRNELGGFSNTQVRLILKNYKKVLKLNSI